MVRIGSRVRGAPGGRLRRLLAVALAVTAGLTGCGVPGHSAHRSSATTVTTVAAPTTTVAKVVTPGTRTVLSPIGLHVRAGPSRSAKILGAAGEGVTLAVLGQSGQWYKVKGVTVTGWIDASPTLSAPGRFTAFTSTTHHFSALYPVSWTVAESPAAATFRSPAGESIVVTTAATIAKLTAVPINYQETGSEQIVACGVTSDLNTYTPESSSPSTAAGTRAAGSGTFVAQIRLTLNPKHAMGIEAHLTARAQLQDVRNFANSVTFPYPQCEG